MLRRALVGALAVTVAGTISVLGATADASAPTSPAAKAPNGSTPAGPLALSGADAAAYRLPADMRRVHSTTYPDGTTATRYQQMVGKAAVLNGQVTVLSDAAGDRTAVIGAHYPGLEATAPARVAPGEAVLAAAQRHGARGTESTDLRIDPRDGRMFYTVDQIRPAQRWMTWVDAATGDVTRSFNALSEGRGKGVKGDRKRFPTTQKGDVFLLKSHDRNGVGEPGESALRTEDVRNTGELRGGIVRDPDNVFDERRPLYASPDDRPAVDAQYYAGVVDAFYADVFNRNSIDDEGMQIRSAVHIAEGYCNAFWNGEQMSYGDGDGRNCLPLSGGLDVAGHELTHGVTEFTSGLIYENESGALNESFSDMMGNTIEFFADRNGLDPAAKPDWRIGEDVIIPTRGFRNMGDPAEFGDPDHYSDLYTGPDDNGGVHSNSGISNLAYYLTINGGSNPGCDGPDPTHQAGCHIDVDGIGLDDASRIFYHAFTALPEYANMCDARRASVAIASYQDQRFPVSQAWNAVGVGQHCEPGIPGPPPCFSDNHAELPFGSPHPYGNGADCRWTYDNGEGSFRFHFSLLDVEEDFDYVYVKNENGKLLKTYTGTFENGATSPCIATPKGIIDLVSDAGFTSQGFTVDAVRPC